MKKKKGYRPNEKFKIKLTDKEDYLKDGEMLDWYLSNVLRLENIKTKQKYKKSEWLKPYIEFNIEKRS